MAAKGDDDGDGVPWVLVVVHWSCVLVLVRAEENRETRCFGIWLAERRVNEKTRV